MAMIISALVIIVAAIALPLANYIPGEIFPNEASVKLSEIFEVIKNGEGVFEFFPSLVFIIAVSCAVLLLIGGACRLKGLCLAASLCGIIGMIIPVIELVEKSDMSIIIGSEGTVTAIGYWVCLVMFVGSFIGALAIKFEKKTTPAAVLPREFSGSPDMGAATPSAPVSAPVANPAITPAAAPAATTPVVNPVITPAAPASTPSVTPVAATPSAPVTPGTSKLRSTMGMGKGATKKTSTASPKDYGFLENQDL